MWHSAKWEWHLHYKRIQAYHTHTYTQCSIQMDCLLSRCRAQHWAAGERLQLVQSHYSLSLLPPQRLWLSIILTCYASMPPLSHSLSFSPSLLAFLSLTAQWSCRIPLFLCPLLCLSAFVYIFLHQTDCFRWQPNCIRLFLERGHLVRTLGIFHLAAHSFGKLSEGRPVLSWSFRNTSIIWFAAHQSPGVCCIAVHLLWCTRTALKVSVRSVGWRKPPQPVISQRRNTVEGQLRSVEEKA